MELKETKGMIFKNMDECNKIKIKVWKIGIISFLILISLAIFNAFDIFYNNILTGILFLIFILSFLLFCYSNFELTLIRKVIRRRIALEHGSCIRSNCTGNFDTCVDIYESGMWICINYISELKKPLDEMFKKIRSKENTVFEYKEGE